MTPAGLRLFVSRALESGALASTTPRALAALGGPSRARALARPLVLPASVPVITVGGATLGGSGKTRVALACVRALERAGASVVLVGHAYRARPGAARVVVASDPLREVGDEALACARAGVHVVVAERRQSALDHAARLRPDAIVVDGPLTTRPTRPALSILALDAAAPWGSRALVPFGDLVAPPDTLMATADHVVRVDPTPSAALVERLRGRRYGLFTALARPARLVASLAIAPSELVRAPDHGPVDARLGRRIREAEARIDMWVSTPKCAIHLDLWRNERIESLVFTDDLVLDDTLVQALRSCLP